MGCSQRGRKSELFKRCDDLLVCGSPKAQDKIREIYGRVQASKQLRTVSNSSSPPSSNVHIPVGNTIQDPNSPSPPPTVTSVPQSSVLDTHPPVTQQLSSSTNSTSFTSTNVVHLSGNESFSPYPPSQPRPRDLPDQMNASSTTMSSSVSEHGSRHSSLSSTSIQSIPSQAYVVQPDVMFKEVPFFRRVQVLVKPTALGE